MKFEWDSNKEQINIKKHHISFKTEELVFGDENRLEIFHSIDEDRYITIGMIDQIAVVLVVVYTMREEETAIRIISARKATKSEREAYFYVNR